MYHAGVQVKFDAHQGINHEKAVMLYSQHTSIIGSSNWTSPSTDSQREHNYFTMKALVFDWLEAQFKRKWNNTTGNIETKAFVPLPPGRAGLRLAGQRRDGSPTSGVSLKWNGGLWAQILRHLLRNHAEPAAPCREPAARPDPVRDRLSHLRACRRCSRARSTTGRSCRRRWRSCRAPGRSGASPRPARPVVVAARCPRPGRTPTLAMLASPAAPAIPRRHSR